VDLAKKMDYAILGDDAPATLSVTTVEGAELRASVAASASPVSEEQLVAKFVDCARYTPKPMGAETVEQIVDQVLSLEMLPDIRAIVEPL